MGWGLRGRITQRLYPSYGYCACCQTVWKLVQGKSVPYHNCTEEARINYAMEVYRLDRQDVPRREDDYCCAGLFALCTECWDKLTPEERLPYYHTLYWSTYTMYYTGLYPNIPIKKRRQAELEWEEIQTRILSDNLNWRFRDGLGLSTRYPESNPDSHTVDQDTLHD